MRLVIAGAGPAGLATALAARTWGMDVTVLDRRPGPSEDGLFLTLAPNGLSVLRTLGVLDPLRAGDVVPTAAVALRSSSGRRLGRLSSGTLDGLPALTLMRGEFARVLLRAAEAAGAEIVWAARASGAEEDARGVTVLTEDGRSWRGDLAVGADGIGSALRTALPGLPGPRPTGILSLGGVAQVPGLASTGDEFQLLWGRQAFFGHLVRPDGTVWWFSNPSDADLPPGRPSDVPQAVWLDRLRRLHAGDPEPVGAILAAASGIDPWLVREMPDLPRWHQGRVVLIGDAAHAVNPATGQGASLALEDAVSLVGALARERSLAAALLAFEGERRPRVVAIAASGRRRSATKAPPHALARAIRDALMPVVLRLFVTDRSLAPVHGWRPGAPWPAP